MPDHRDHQKGRDRQHNRNQKKRSATALSYNGYSTPRVSASGEGDLADQILKLASEHDIPIRQDRALAALLSQVKIGDEIPPLLYVAVAEALAFAYLLHDELRTVSSNQP